MAPTASKVNKDRREQKVEKRKAQEQIKLIQEQRNRIEKEKAEYLRQRDEEVKKIQELQAKVEAGATEVQAEYDKLKNERKDKPDQTENFEERLKENEAKQKDIEEMEWEGEDGEGRGELKREPSDGPDFPPDDFETGGDDEGGPLFTLGDLRKALGQEDGGKVIAWKEMGSTKVCITRFGPRNAPRFRIQKAADVLDSWTPTDLPMFTHPSLRFGEMKDENGKHIYPDRGLPGNKVLGIKAVAWYFADGEESPEKLLEPKTRPKRTNVKAPKRDPLYPETQILLEWIIDGEKKISWEVRSTVVRLYKTTPLTIDQFIYVKAANQEERYLEWKNDQRQSEDRSPTPFAHILKPQAAETDKAEEKPEVAPKTSEEQKEKAARDKWAKKKGLDPDKLSDANEARFDVYWETRQVTVAAAA